MFDGDYVESGWPCVSFAVAVFTATLWLLAVVSVRERRKRVQTPEHRLERMAQWEGEERKKRRWKRREIRILGN